MQTLVTRPPAAGRPSCQRRAVTGIWLGGYRLAGTATRGFAAASHHAVVLSPGCALRDGCPANVGVWTSAGALVCVLPVSWQRLQAETNTARAERLFDGFWQAVAGADPVAGDTPIWSTGGPVGNLGVELGASGDRPYGHPWVTLAELDGGLHLVCALSSRAPGARERSYQAFFDANALRDLAGRRLREPHRPLLPADGAAELSHFAVVNPSLERWTRVGAMAEGTAGALGHTHLLDRFRGVWPQCGGGPVPCLCPFHASPNAQCDECAGR